MLSPLVNFDIQQFVDREVELGILMGLADSLRQKNDMRSDERVLHIVGKSNIGKSTLLQRYYYQLVLNPDLYLPMLIDMQQFVELSLEEFSLTIMRFIDEKVSQELSITPLYLSESSITSRDYSEWLTINIKKIQRSKIIVFLFDEVSMLSNSQVESLEDNFLIRWLHNPNIVFILTGRNAVTGWKDFALRPTQKKNVIELLGFNFEYTERQIQRLDSRAGHLASKIHELSGGSPGNNKNVVRRIVDDSLQIVEIDAIRACNQELYEAVSVYIKNLPENLAIEILPALESLCVLQDFDKEYEAPIMFATHKNLNGVWDVKRSASVFTLLTNIQIGPGRLVDWDMVKSAYAVEEQTRFNLEQELKLRDRQLWKTLHCSAMNMYQKWAHEYGSDIFQEKANYHKSRLQQAGFDPENCL